MTPDSRGWTTHVNSSDVPEVIINMQDVQTRSRLLQSFLYRVAAIGCSHHGNQPERKHAIFNINLSSFIGVSASQQCTVNIRKTTPPKKDFFNLSIQETKVILIVRFKQILDWSYSVYDTIMNLNVKK